MTNEPCPVFRSAVTLKSHIERTGAKRVVLTNGCFDPLHVGHIRYLYGAKEHGDFLVVALNDDESTRALKGENRPVMPAADRSKLIAALEMVDAVLIFSARNAGRVLKSLRPALHAKGTDYTVETVPERDVSTALGIETVIVGDPKWHGSSDVMKRIQQSKDRRGGTAV